MDELIKLDQVDEIVFDTTQVDEQPLSIGEGVAIIGDGIGEEELNKILETKADVSYVDEKFNGANKAVSFVNYSSMISSLNALPNTSYNVGQNIMIVTLSVPDLWVSEVVEESVTYAYVSDDDFVTGLTTNGSVQVGHYKLSALETQKVDLTEYVKNTDYATDGKGGVVKVNQTYGTRMVSGVLDLMPAQYSEIDNRSHNEYPLYMVSNNTRHMIVPANVDYAVKKALTDNVLADTNQAWTDEDKASARDLLGAVKKIDTSGFLRVYGIAGNGVQTTYDIISKADHVGEGKLPRYVKNTIDETMYESDCVLSSGTPTKSHHVTNKDYVDGLVGDINTALEGILGV